jgi:outer membrane protein TolC
MFRQVLGLPLGTTINYTWVDMAPSIWEGKPVADQVKNAMAIAPEYQQLDYLMKAAKANKLTADWGFINSATASAQSNAGSNASFGDMTGALSFHFGFDYFPNIQLNAQKMVDVQLQETQMNNDITQTVEMSSDSLVQSTLQFSTAQAAEQNATDAWVILKQKYDLGLVDLESVLTAHQSIAQASSARIKAEQDLNVQRVSLHRSMITDQFALIQGCKATPMASGGLFKKSPPKKSLVDICTEGGTKQ